MAADWETRWPPERRIAFIRDSIPDFHIKLIFEAMMRENGFAL